MVMAGMARQGRRGKVRSGELGTVGLGVDGVARRGVAGMVWMVPARRGGAGQATAWNGSGAARQARNVYAARVKIRHRGGRHGRRGEAGGSWFWLGRTTRAETRRGPERQAWKARKAWWVAARCVRVR
jgi:hypothetical protein